MSWFAILWFVCNKKPFLPKRQQWHMMMNFVPLCKLLFQKTETQWWGPLNPGCFKAHGLHCSSMTFGLACSARWRQLRGATTAWSAHHPHGERRTLRQHQPRQSGWHTILRRSIRQIQRQSLVQRDTVNSADPIWPLNITLAVLGVTLYPTWNRHIQWVHLTGNHKNSIGAVGRRKRNRPESR